MEKRLTFAGTKTGHSIGVSEFVMQEEFHRFSGYWWAPDASNCILAVEVDESDVDFVYIPHDSDGSKDEFRYPRTGSKNATADIVLLESSTDLDDPDKVCSLFSTYQNMIISLDDKQFQTARVAYKRLWGAFSLKQRFPWMEYLPRMGWLPDGSGVWVQVLDRSQGYLEMVRIDRSEFMTYEEYEEVLQHHGGDEDTLREQLCPPLITEQSSVWVNITDIIAFLPSTPAAPSTQPAAASSEQTVATARSVLFVSGANGVAAEGEGFISAVSSFSQLPDQPSSPHMDVSLAPAPQPPNSSRGRNSTVKFIWASERTGYRHLYLVTWTMQGGVVDMTALTSGQWQVVDHQLSFDAERGLVYFVAKMDTPLGTFGIQKKKKKKKTSLKLVAVLFVLKRKPPLRRLDQAPRACPADYRGRFFPLGHSKHVRHTKKNKIHVFILFFFFWFKQELYQIPHVLFVDPGAAQERDI